MRSNQDSHILDWDLITKGQSNTTKDRSSIEARRADNKGIVFEDLIEKLLAAMFPRETWRRTIKSHDGKRDFVYPANEHLPDQKWAECKNYNYLIDGDTTYWTLTPTVENTYSAYRIVENIESSRTSRTGAYKYVYYLSNRLVYVSGTGTENDPYIVK